MLNAHQSGLADLETLNYFQETLNYFDSSKSTLLSAIETNFVLLFFNSNTHDSQGYLKGSRHGTSKKEEDRLYQQTAWS